MPIQLRISDNDPYVYIEPVLSGSVAIGTDDLDSNKLKIVVSDAVSDLDPGSGTISLGTCSLSIDPTINGNIEFCPKGVGQSTFARGNVEIRADAGKQGNLLMQNTPVGGDWGVIQWGGFRFIHNRGNNNTFVGSFAGNTSLTVGAQNVGVGTSSLVSLTTGNNNAVLGFNAALQLTTGSSNNALGSAALFSATTGEQNVSIGNLSLDGITTGSNNTAVGHAAGTAYASTESSNIVIGNIGTIADNNKIIIGTQGAGPGQQNTCFIAGINGVSVTAAGTVVISSAGQLGTVASFPTIWNEITAASAGMAVNNGYIAFRATLVTLTLPAVAAQGSRLEILGKGTGGFLIAQNAGQTIRFNSLSTTTGVAGSLASTLQYNAVQLICITANTDFIVESSSGNLTVV